MCLYKGFGFWFLFFKKANFLICCNINTYLRKLFECASNHCFLVTYDNSLTSSKSLFTGLSLVARLAEAVTGGGSEDWDPVVPAGGTATGVELLQILIPTPLQVGHSGTYMVSSCAEAHKLIDWHNLGYSGRRTGQEEEREKS